MIKFRLLLSVSIHFVQATLAVEFTPDTNLAKRFIDHPLPSSGFGLLNVCENVKNKKK
ncbi:hypothetical protein [Pedobacter sp. R20-19]|uniref:hypothetical protein n=1 Tax=Pedobacter sp. R20-19 TaxID=1270196 RepID=UPI000ABB5E31|nr:hypothetical protein [Pedobacter sp. R20-19]